MKKLYALITICLFFSQLHAQSWQWGKRGGGDGSFQETIIDMAIDPHNNVYVLSTVESGVLTVDNHPKTGYGNLDIMLASFTCDGAYRWSKVIGGWNNDLAGGLKADSFGHIYVSGRATPAGTASQTNVHFDTDTSFSTLNIKRYLFLVQYDTGGNYKWLRMPQPDTLSFANALSYSQPIDFAIDDQGDINWLCWLPAGAFVNGSYIVASQSIHMLKYDVNGNFIGGFPFDISGTAVNFKMQRDPLTKRFYVAGNLSTGTLSMGGNAITHALYLAAFSSTGQFIWKKEDTHAPGAGGTVWRPAIDLQGNIFMNGSSAPGDTFNTYVLANSGNSDPFVIKLDSNGTNIWGQSAVTTAAQGNALSLTTNNEVVLAGSYPASLSWQGYTGWTPTITPNQGYNMCITRFNAQTGSVLGIDTLGSNFGVDDFSSAIVSDKKGNVYLGGRFGDQLYVAGDTLYSNGTPFDFVVAKYGYSNCNCSIIPASNYTYTVNGVTHVANFTYTGTMPMDSIRWTFGDGNTSNQTNPSHTYTTNGSYNVCATVYTPCGSATYCHTIQVTVGVNPLSAFQDVAIYPNPSTDKLHIDNLKEAASYRIVNLVGSTIQQGTLQSGSNEISLKGIPSGTYLLQLTDNEGQREVVRVVKE